MRISLIAAMDKNRGIGYKGGLPWVTGGKNAIPADMKRFRALTTGHTVMMGRNTFESIGTPLPHRTNIVITRDPEWKFPGVITSNFHKHAFNDAASAGETECFVIGGQTLFEHVLWKVERMYLTMIDGIFMTDKHFPAWQNADWKEVSREETPPDEKNAYGLTFLTLDRTQKEV